MSGAKHTPGPWAVAARKWQIATQGPATEWLATMPHSASDGFGLTDVGEIAANARLIAAAPDLLAALKALQLQALQSSVNDPSNEWGQEALAMTRAAISRATGEA